MATQSLVKPLPAVKVRLACVLICAFSTTACDIATPLKMVVMNGDSPVRLHRLPHDCWDFGLQVQRRAAARELCGAQLHRGRAE